MIPKFQFKSVKTRLIFWLLLVAMLPVIVVMSITYMQRTTSIKGKAFDKLKTIRDLKVMQVNSWIEQIRGDILTVSQDHEIRDLEQLFNRKERTSNDLATLANARKLLERHLQNYQSYNEIFIINPLSGRIEISTSKHLEGKDRSKNPYFTEPMRTKQSYLKDIYYSETLMSPCMSISVPIFCLAHQEEHCVGIVVARINLEDSLYALLLNRTGMGKTGETLIVNKEVLALNKLRWYEHPPLKLTITAKPAVQASMGKTGITEVVDYRNEKVLAAYTYIEKTGWGFVAKQDLKELYAPIQDMLKNALILFFVTLLTVFLLAYILAKNFSKPLLDMAEVARQIRKGDIAVRNHVSSSDEIGYLAQSFNAMADSLESQMQVRENVVNLTEAMIEFLELDTFRENILKKLVDITDSNLGAYHLLNRENDTYEHFTSIGISPELLEPFDAALLEGEFGQALATKKIVHTRNIPADTHFTFKTFTGTILPKEIITIPLVVDGLVVSVISLASLKPYSKESLEILDRVWIGMNTVIANLLANDVTKKLATELADKNQELQAQSEELQAQSEELQQTSEEIQEQNLELQAQKQQVEDANRIKSEFLSNMSHELRTPLNSVMALSRVLIMQTQEKLSQEELNYLEIIQQNGKKLLALINSILDLSKIEAGKMDINPKKFSLQSSIETVMERLEPLAAEKGVTLHQEIPATLPQIENDEIRVDQILQNLIGNAIKFTADGRVTVSVESDSEKVTIQVADTGIGIAEPDLPHIFEQFIQVDGSSARAYEGTGLGLAIAYKAAKMLNGDLTVASTLGEGSTFTLTLPLRWAGVIPDFEPLSFSPSGEAKPSQKSENTGERQRILLVEDNEAATIQVRKVLESAGYIVDVTRGGQEALAYVEQTIPDGIILDLMMPEMDGFEVLEKIRGTKATAKIPVLILTAKDLTSKDLQKLSSNNIQQLIHKGDVERKVLLFKIGLMMGAEPKIKQEAETLISETQEPERGVRKRQRETDGFSTILVVEDNPDNMISIKAVLQNKYTILEATNGKMGLSLALSESPDLILLDMSLPEMDGFSVVKKVKEDQNAGQIPVIALTANAMKGDREMIIAAGCDDYIAKPFDPKEVLQKIKEWLEK
ncbi:MAG: response regulator [Desulfuromusa sp.]|nr:response regulator [Desulfuromusa sp.]